MLQILVPATEQWDEKKQEFVVSKEQVLQLEHSLVSVSKWESKWHKAFLSKRKKTYEETLDYIKFMTLTKNVKPETYLCLTKENMEQIDKYIEDPMTASYLPELPGSQSQDTVTSELIYYWMTSLNIPFECQKWHLNRLLSLIKVCNVKTNPPKKMSKGAIARRNSATNAARRSRLHSKG